MALKRNLAIGGTVLAAAAFAGGAYAATQQSGTSERQQFLGDVANRLGVSPAQLNSALRGAFLDQLQAAVAAGRLTQAQANALEQRMQRTGGWPSAMPWGMGRDHWFGLSADSPFSAAAAYLGVDAAQLLKDLRSGQTLARIAQQKGKSVVGLKAVMAAATKARLDKLVASKVITSVEEQQILSRLSDKLDGQINATGAAPAFRFGHGLMRPSGAAMPVPPPEVPVE